MRYCLIWNTPKALTRNGIIRPGIVLMMFIFVATRYRGIMIASKGIIIVLIIAINTAFCPLNLYFARPNPQSEARSTVVMAHTLATIRELNRLRKNILSPWLPTIAFWKFVKKVRVDVVKYSEEGIHVYGMLIICFASINAAVAINNNGRIQNIRTIESKT